MSQTQLQVGAAERTSLCSRCCTPLTVRGGRTAGAVAATVTTRRYPGGVNNSVFENAACEDATATIITRDSHWDQSIQARGWANTLVRWTRGAAGSKTAYSGGCAALPAVPAAPAEPGGASH